MPDERGETIVMTATLGGPRDSRIVLGWREWVGLPDLGIPALKVKVDTGARTSSLHAARVERIGNGRVRFCVYPHQNDDDDVIEAEADLVDERFVRNSGGHAERRPVIRTVLLIEGIHFGAELTLSNRALLGFRMLLGREALRGRFLVDPGQSYRCGRGRDLHKEEA